MSGSRAVQVLRTSAMPILHQLRLEEALLRTTKQNWLLLNDGTPTPAIVLGISGTPGKMVHMPAAKSAGVQLIKRYTGGGTVIVDHNTVFITMIFNKTDVPDVQPFPCPIMKFTGQVYSDVFDVLMSADSSRPQQRSSLATCTGKAEGFSVRENDYCWGDKKIAGNAQAIVKDRWLHHTSFLWDYRNENMKLLQEPKRRPQYRGERQHDQFLTPLKSFGFRRRDFLECVEEAMTSQGFEMTLTNLQDVQEYLHSEHLKSTKVLPYDDVRQTFTR